MCGYMGCRIRWGPDCKSRRGVRTRCSQVGRSPWGWDSHTYGGSCAIAWAGHILRYQLGGEVEGDFIFSESSVPLRCLSFCLS